jgi:hypothetical protein
MMNNYTRTEAVVDALLGLFGRVVLSDSSVVLPDSLVK